MAWYFPEELRIPPDALFDRVSSPRCRLELARREIRVPISTARIASHAPIVKAGYSMMTLKRGAGFCRTRCRYQQLRWRHPYVDYAGGFSHVSTEPDPRDSLSLFALLIHPIAVVRAFAAHRFRPRCCISAPWCSSVL
jgi:hypothetical protein